MIEPDKLFLLPDISVPPPAPPPVYGTVSYPFHSDELSLETPVALPRKKISLDRKAAEKG